MSLEEKMLLRFQKERQRRARASSSSFGGGGGRGGRFSLEGGEEEEEGFEEDDEYGGFRLTHKGRALGADDYRVGADALASSDEEDAGGALGKEIVKVGVCCPCVRCPWACCCRWLAGWTDGWVERSIRALKGGGLLTFRHEPTHTQELHFGGGGGGMGVLGRKRALPSSATAAADAGEGEGEGGGHEAKKTRAELLEEIIAKSKLHKVHLWVGGACIYGGSE